MTISVIMHVVLSVIFDTVRATARVTGSVESLHLQGRSFTPEGICTCCQMELFVKKIGCSTFELAQRRGRGGRVNSFIQE